MTRLRYKWEPFVMVQFDLSYPFSRKDYGIALFATFAFDRCLSGIGYIWAYFGEQGTEFNVHQSFQMLPQKHYSELRILLTLLNNLFWTWLDNSRNFTQLWAQCEQVRPTRQANPRSVIVHMIVRVVALELQLRLNWHQLCSTLEIHFVLTALKRCSACCSSNM